MAKINFLKSSEKSKKPEHLSHIQKLEEKICNLEKDMISLQNDHKATIGYHILNYKNIQKEYNRSRLLNAILFISHSILAYIHFHK